jgi:hypothetical protein
LKYIADNRPENNPWHGVDEWALKVKITRICVFIREKRINLLSDVLTGGSKQAY